MARSLARYVGDSAYANQPAAAPAVCTAPSGILAINLKSSVNIEVEGAALPAFERDGGFDPSAVRP
ncbi:MAG: hypothetical protein OHK0044_14720 [Burkholderiaceae bacterium]